MARSRRAYFLYGAWVRCHWPLPYLEKEHPGACDVELIQCSAARMRQARREAVPLDSSPDTPLAAPITTDAWFEHRKLPDQSTYLRWLGIYEFLISPDGRQVASRMPEGVSEESFRVYLLNGALPVALLQFGYDPLHATVSVVNGRAVGFLGRSGYGKSTLGGAFLQAGYPILTDDLVVAKSEPAGWMAYPGPPRIKLLPNAARAVMREQSAGVAMNPQTSKLVIPLGTRQSVDSAVPLQTLYVLNRPTGRVSSRIRIQRLSSRRAFLSLVKNSYNDWLSDPARLNLQFLEYSQMATQVKVKLLSYPRLLDRLAAVRQAILADLER